MAASSLSLTCVLTTLPKRFNNHPQPSDLFQATSTFPGAGSVTCSKMEEGSVTCSKMEENLTTQREDHFCWEWEQCQSVYPKPIPFWLKGCDYSTEVPKNYESFVDLEDGYSYYYPSDWREFDFRGHDSAFKDRYLQLQNVRVRFLPTEKKDIHEIGPIEEVVHRLVSHVYPAPTQKPTIYSMEERTVDGKNYYTFEYILESKNYASASFATIAVANGRYYTLIVGANERRWKRFRNMLKVVADSFRVIDI